MKRILSILFLFVSLSTVAQSIEQRLNTLTNQKLNTGDTNSLLRKSTFLLEKAVINQAISTNSNGIQNNSLAIQLAQAYLNKVDTNVIAATRTQPFGTLTPLNMFAKTGPMVIMYSGTSIFNNGNAGIKSIVLPAMIRAWGWSGNTTYNFGKAGGDYITPYNSWPKQPYGGYSYTRLRGAPGLPTLSFTGYMKKYKLRYSKDTNGGDFVLTIDGVPVATISCNGPQSYANEYVYDFGTPGYHNIAINAPSSGFSYLETYDFILDNPGVHFMDASLGGSTMARYFTIGTATSPVVAGIPIVGYNGFNAVLNNANIGATLIIEGHGVNDAGLGMNNFNVTYKPAMDSLVNSVKYGNKKLLLVIEAGGHYSLPSDPGYATFQAIRNLLLSYRNRENVTVLDWHAAMGLNTTDLPTLKRVMERYYNIHNINPATGTTSDPNDDTIHPIDGGQAILSEMALKTLGLQATGSGKTTDVAAIADVQPHTSLPSVSAGPLYSTAYQVQGYTTSSANRLGVTNTYRVIGTSIEGYSGQSRPLVYSEAELNYMPALNDSIANSITSDSNGKYRVYSNASPWQLGGGISIPTQTWVAAGFTVTLTLGPGAHKVTIQNAAKNAYLPVLIDGVSYQPTAAITLTNNLTTPQVFHITVADVTATSFFFSYQGMAYNGYLTFTNHACVPGSRYDQAKFIMSPIAMTSDIPATKVRINQSYLETVNGKTIEKTAIGTGVFKPLDVAGNRYYGLYRIRDKTTIDVQKMTITGTLTPGAYSEQFGTTTTTTSASPTYIYAPTQFTNAKSGQTYTITGAIAYFPIVMTVQLFNGSTNTYLGLNLDGTWSNNGSSSALAPNILANTGSVFGRQIAVTFQLPDSSLMTSGNWQLRLFFSNTRAHVDNWYSAEGSSAAF